MTNGKIGLIKGIGKLVFEVPEKIEKMEKMLAKVRTCEACNALRESCNQKIDTVIQLLESRRGGD